MNETRVTEQSNPLTVHLDELNSEEIIRQISAADHEVFGSATWGSGLFDPTFLERLQSLRHQVKWVLQQRSGIVILSGAGTSGRLAVHAAHLLRAHFHTTRVFGLIAGGLQALVQAKERAEDLPTQGLLDLNRVLNDKEPFVFIGVSCGFSAAYVGAQLERAMNLPQGTTVALGFNPIAAASQRPLGDHSFYDILKKLAQRPNGLILNPILGPEPIQGSTRMKGGTATKIILDLLTCDLDLKQSIRGYQNLHERFSESPHWTSLVEAAGHTLTQGGSLFYLPSHEAGFAAFLDAAECPPTFGAKPHQVQTIASEAFQTQFPEHKRFETPIIKEPHVVFGIGSQAPREQLPKALIASPYHELGMVPGLWTSALEPLQARFKELWWKWTLNTLSTGAFIRAGKVYGNRMIDLKISNLKLWERATGIVADLAKVPASQAEKNLKLVVGGSTETEQTPEALIPRAVRTEFVVAKAVLTASKHVSPTEAHHLLTRFPRLKDCLHHTKTQGDHSWKNGAFPTDYKT